MLNAPARCPAPLRPTVRRGKSISCLPLHFKAEETILVPTPRRAISPGPTGRQRPPISPRIEVKSPEKDASQEIQHIMFQGAGRERQSPSPKLMACHETSAVSAEFYDRFRLSPVSAAAGRSRLLECPTPPCRAGNPLAYDSLFRDSLFGEAPVGVELGILGFSPPSPRLGHSYC
eukprot:TRINITY_DN18076_c3_g4_i1.p1 TRINITY_DN18076_c3_g4~~TRINITY_DN18076_c3_g4_i1.p1  ORF type:complete len:175 (-),score=29.37 TRINITY_DN18076_c3_g4_i1:150-674(-)